jgi:hypothetical protein
MQAGDKFDQPSLRVNELWQTDFTYFKIIGWGWYYRKRQVNHMVERLLML